MTTVGFQPPVFTETGAAPRLVADARWCGRHGIGRFAAEVLQRIGRYQPVPSNIGLLSPLEPFQLRRAVARLSADAYFSPGFNPPYGRTPGLVFTVHDLIHVRFAAESSIPKRLYYERVVRPAILTASSVLTVTEFSRREIVEWSGVDPSRVRVVGNGVSAAFTAAGPAYQSPRPYFLYVGNRKPHKNPAGLLAAFQKLSAEADLYLSGVADAATEALVEQFALRPRIRFLGSVSDAELAAYYRGAQALVVPSFYEGFCVPMIEAMSCGCPVVASASTAQAEVAGSAALLVDPGDPASIGDGMRETLRPNARARLVDAGSTRATDFSWDRTAGAVREALACAAPRQVSA